MIYFWVKESFKLIRRAKASFFLSLISTCISVLLISASLLSIKLSNQLQNELKQNVSINVFLKDTLSSSSIAQMKSDLSKRRYINSINYIDKDEAAQNFIKETGEDFRKLLDYNPLPASFTITLKENYVEKDSLKRVISSISKIGGVDEVVFQQEFIYKLLNYLSRIRKYIFAITFVLLFISIYIVYSTVKLIVNAKYEELETMKLVGAKLSTIKMPIILNCIFIGILAGLIAFAVFKVLQFYFSNFIPFYQTLNLNDPMYLIILLSIGPLLGLFVSIFSLRKITLKI
ncbi:MAG TPA: permease-like cell division protein FtsX [Ignavibacteriaceae bacterium]|nr:permease-like cell division protein FtsX [Ignavibacteriaceae bacterium]